MAAKWVGTWKGGRVREGARGRVYWIERMRDGVRYQVRLAGVRSDREAEDEFDRWAADPSSYVPPAVQEELDALDEAESEVERIEIEAESVRLVMTDKMLDAFGEAQSNGYGTRAPASPHHASICRSFLAAWASHPAIEGRDIRTVTLLQWREALATGVSAVPVAGGPADMRPWASLKMRIIALRSYTAWLRWSGQLSRTEDTTLDLSVPQGRRPSPRERASRAYSVDELQRTYAAIDSQAVRDLFWLRVHTGLHESEIKRASMGECVIDEVPNGGRIAAVIEVRHKSSRNHRQSVDAPTLARVARLMGRTRDGKFEWIGHHTLTRHRIAAAEASGCRQIYMGHLRHTRTTLLERVGEEVTPPGDTRGVPLDRVARSHGHSTATAAAYYSGVNVPPMLCVPVVLQHPDDP